MQRPRPHNPPPSRRPLPVVTGWVEKRDVSLPLPPDPHLPAPYDDQDLRAWRALNVGEASPEQQMRCLAHLFFLTGFSVDPYVPGDPHASAYGMGKRRVGVEIGRLIATRPRSASDTEQGV